MFRGNNCIAGLAVLAASFSTSVYGCSIAKTLQSIQDSAITLDVAMTKEARMRLRDEICAAVADSHLRSLSNDERDALASSVIVAYVARLARDRAQDPSLKTLLLSRAEKDGLIELPSAGWAAPVPRAYGWVNIYPADAAAQSFVVNGEDVGASRKILALAGEVTVAGRNGRSVVCSGKGEVAVGATTDIACTGNVSP